MLLWAAGELFAAIPQVANWAKSEARLSVADVSTSK